MSNHNTEEIKITRGGIVKLEYTDHFAQEQFIEHIMEKYGDPKDNRLLYLYSVRALELVIAYGLEHHNVSKNQLSYFLFDVIPDVEHAEIVAYCDNDILTNNARLEKYDYWDTKGAEV
jgi:hypothetical protein